MELKYFLNMKIIGKDIINEVHKRVKELERLRMNYNINESLYEGIYKLINSLQPETVMPIHRHFYLVKKETFVLLQGALEVFKYNGDKKIIEKCLMNKENGDVICEIMSEEWHSFNVLLPYQIH